MDMKQSHSIVKDSGLPLISSIKAFLDAPLESSFLSSFLNLFNGKESFSSHNFAGQMDSFLLKIQSFFIEKNITILSVALYVLLMFIFYSVFYALFSSFKKQFLFSFEKFKILSGVFISSWVLLGLLAINKNNPFGNISSWKSLAFTLGIALLLAISLFFAFSVILSYFPEFLMLFPPLLIIAGYAVSNYFSYVPPYNVTKNICGVLLIVFLLGVALKFFLNKHLGNLKECVLVVLENSIQIILFIFFISIFHFILIKITVALGYSNQSNSLVYFFLFFMNSWTFFTFSYLITVFTSSTLSLSSSSENSENNGMYYRMMRALEVCWESLDFILYLAAFAAFIQTFISFLESMHSLLKSYNNLICRIFSYVLAVVIFVFKFLLAFINFNNSQELITVGQVGYKKYFENQKNERRESIVFLTTLYGGMSKFLEGTPHLLLILVSIKSFTFLSFNATFLYFSIFVSLNVFIYLLNAIFIANQIQMSKKRKNKLIQ
jgi:hypothetical protein